ncbi:copper resistance protein CopC [Mycobacterium riyadhense]|uniref:Copper resistance protein CopC n=1 Tax=Mycobacterium riyadhense TaxID=486698 RepID=A0A653EBD2_9MYCO|nr:copper resistance protein CopC [Mycobacterium riyadhense]VTO94668.1 hypothetical protein BIN_B_00141 [Mycobacterium riyadhense]
MTPPDISFHWISRSVIAIALAAALYLGSVVGIPTASAHGHASCDKPVHDGMSIVTFQRSTFKERLHPTFAAMTAVGPDANIWSAAAPSVRGAVVTVGLRPLGPAGRDTVNYRLTSADGQASGSAWYGLTAPGTGTPGPAAAANDEGADIPAWPFAVGAIVAVGAGALWAIRRRP